MEIEELSKKVKGFLITNTTNIKDNLTETELKEFKRNLTEIWEMTGKQFNKWFISLVANRSYECFINEIDHYKAHQYFKQNDSH